jgi:GTP cyclohydrolase IA
MRVDLDCLTPVGVSGDTDAAEAAAGAFLTALGVPLEGEARRRTPARMARAYRDLLAARSFNLTTFPNEEGYEQLVIVRRIPFRSLCEHHALPFVGTADIGYLPAERILGLSKLARLVEFYGCRPQVQERMTKQIADWLDQNLAPKGVGVVLRAEHLCMTSRGVRAAGTSTVTSALSGLVLSDPRAREEFFLLAGAAGELR